jgi:UDP-N-acetylmuramoyl-L-alanyl-D-glutamate--2,6-diaminopimelate ligase
MMAGPLQDMHCRLAALLQGLLRVPEEADRAVRGLEIDSRRIRPDDLFLACRGRTVDGAEYIDEAIARGAVAVLWEPEPGATAIPLTWRQPPEREAIPVLALAGLSQRLGAIADRFYGQPSRALHLTGVTGTNGKTSVSWFLAQAQHHDAPCGLIGTLGHGLAGAVEAGTHTTPDAVTVHRWLAELREQGAASVAMEVSSHALDQGRVNQVAFDTAVFTNLSHEHLDYHGDMQAYAAAKQRLFEMPGLRQAVLNLDEPLGRELAARLAGKTDVLGYGLQAEAAPDILARRIEFTATGMDVEVSTPRGEGRFETALLGRFNVSNLLAVLGVLLLRGIPLPGALARLAVLKPVPGRMQSFGGGARPRVVVDYAHTPDALEQVLNALREHTAGDLICVFGCGGDRDAAKRPLMGAIAGRLADRVILTNDNPRSEDPAAILDAIESGMPQPAAVLREPDRQRAIAIAIAAARPGDVVLVAGKGHEAWQIIDTEKRPFSDIEQVEQQLEAWT